MPPGGQQRSNDDNDSKDDDVDDNNDNNNSKDNNEDDANNDTDNEDNTDNTSDNDEDNDEEDYNSEEDDTNDGYEINKYLHCLRTQLSIVWRPARPDHRYFTALSNCIGLLVIIRGFCLVDVPSLATLSILHYNYLLEGFSLAL